MRLLRSPPAKAMMAIIVEGKKPWAQQRLLLIEQRVRTRLGALSSHLGEREWRDGAFSAGDLLRVTVVRRLPGSGLVEEHENLAANATRGEARPAFQRAFGAQRDLALRD